MTEILRLSAFAETADGGNPAGVILDASTLTAGQMLRIAADLGYAESAFVTAPPTAAAPRAVGIRYYSPIAEVPFCGHATVATAVALAERHGVGPFVFETAAGPVVLDTSRSPDGIMASFTSIEPAVSELPDGDRDDILALLGLGVVDLAAGYPPRLSHAGNPHPVLVLARSDAFDAFTFDPAAMRALMDRRGWTGTVTILHAMSGTEFEARNPFPVGSMAEDPATGSAAASVGAYLRDLGLIAVPGHVVIHQGRHVGRPSVLHVDVPVTGGITVTGTATPIAG
ncbi:PhzF family phenazine biosynthesis protein [Specibacter cremeus]|uniref:PhzF family phenazine biosynthesis protein n=1 Tax=Specibacter cremeus TaxID=1629051 RepID=UPI000F79D9C8|nr:PhzF family phenazine biosynthesis protein [Specibacter cremeus]